MCIFNDAFSVRVGAWLYFEAQPTITHQGTAVIHTVNNQLWRLTVKVRLSTKTLFNTFTGMVYVSA